MDRTTYFVTRHDETRATGSPASSDIPTLFAATKAFDQYRTVGICETNLNELNVAFTDVGAVSAICKIAEGGIADYREIEAAETALQALLLHEVVHVIIPAPKVEFDSGRITYVRLDAGLRTNFGFDLFGLAQSRDWLIAPEFARIEGDQFVSTSLADSPILGQRLLALSERRVPYWNNAIVDAVNAAIQDHGIPAYLTDPALSRGRRGYGFPKRFYHRMRISWDKAVGDMPPIVCTFTLPPLLAVVLDRLNNRADLRIVVAELREELKEVRAELLRLNNTLTLSTSQSEVEGMVRHIEESFSAIVPKSRLSDAQRMRRSLGIVHYLTRPILKFMAAFAKGTGVSMSDLTGFVYNDLEKVFESRAIVDRTITATTFSGLLRTEAIQSLVKHHLSTTEINAVERSLMKAR